MDTKDLLNHYGAKIQQLDKSIDEYYYLVGRTEGKVKKLSSELQTAKHDLEDFSSTLKKLEEEKSIIINTIDTLEELKVSKQQVS